MKSPVQRRPGLWKVLLIAGIALGIIAFVLGWIGFGVPDWQAFQRYNGSSQEYYGLWAYCQQQSVTYTTVCKRWSDAETQLFNGSRPSFVRTAEGLITTGMILLSFGLASAVAAAILPLLAYLAGALMFLGFLFLIIGLPIFGRQSDDFSASRGDANYNKRYGFWLIVPTIILAFLSSLLFLAAGFVYQRFGFGNLATHSYSRRTPAYGGQRLLGPANMVRGMPYAMRPPYYAPGGPGMIGNPYLPPVGVQGPSLLSQYIAQRIPQYQGLPMQRYAVSALPQPSIARAYGQPASYVAPAYHRSPYGAPVINLTGQTLVGPPVRIG